MRKTLMLLVLAGTITLAAPSGASAGHCGFHCCHHHCFSRCWGGCWGGWRGGCGPCFRGWCGGFAPFVGCGFRPCCFPAFGVHTSFCLPSCLYNYAPVPCCPIMPAPILGSALESRDLPVTLSVNRETLANQLARLRSAVAPQRAVTTPTAAPATVIVLVPADAKLTANGRVLATETERRVFESPDLQPGKSFQYAFTAEVVRDGKPLTLTKKVVVRAGEETQVQFDLPPALVSR